MELVTGVIISYDKYCQYFWDHKINDIAESTILLIIYKKISSIDNKINK